MHMCSSKKTTIYKLSFAFALNILLSLFEGIGGIISGSIALIGDALHNTMDAGSLLIALIAFKIAFNPPTHTYTYGFKRAEVIGTFVNLILLFISGLYLLGESIIRVFQPRPLDGLTMIYIAFITLVIDVLTARISHQHSHHSMNMKILFIHNLADAFGSCAVIFSGLCVYYFDIQWVDGVMGMIIASYMIIQAFLSFPKIVKILMNAAPQDIHIADIKKDILSFKEISDVHHMHLWYMNETDISFECHICTKDTHVLKRIASLLKEKYGIYHITLQSESKPCKNPCSLE